MRITQGTFSFLPDLTDKQIGAQLKYALDKGWAIGNRVHRRSAPAQHVLGNVRQSDVRHPRPCRDPQGDQRLPRDVFRITTSA
jgi:ribulose bisphosphate carboxylase small subunit